MSRREIGIAALALGAVALWIYYQNRQAAAAASAALAANPSSSDNGPNAAASGDLNDGAGSFG